MTINRLRGSTCTYCGTRLHPPGSAEAIVNPTCVATRDHVIPQLFATSADRRVKSAANLVPACAGCNNVKGAYPPEVFRFFLAETRGTARFNRTEFQRFVYGLALAGYRAAVAHALARRPDPDPLPPRRSTFTLRDLRRRA